MSWLDGGVGGGGEVLEDDYLWGEVRPPNRTLAEKCDAAFTYDYHVAVAVSCVMVLLFGIVYSLFGESACSPALSTASSVNLFAWLS